MAIKKFYMYAKLVGENTVYVFKEICMNTPSRPEFRHEQKELISESEDLNILIDSLKELCGDLFWDGIILIFGNPYKDYGEGSSLYRSITSALKIKDGEEIEEEIEFGIRILTEEEENIIMDGAFPYAQKVGLFFEFSRQEISQEESVKNL